MSVVLPWVIRGGYPNPNTFSTVLQRCTPWRKLQATRGVVVAPAKPIQSTARPSLCNVRFSSTTTAVSEKNSVDARRLYDLSIQLSQRPVNGNSPMQYTRYACNGVAPVVGQSTKLDIANSYGLSTRDLHVFDLPSDGFSHILVRENTILVHLFDLRLLVQHDHALLFNVTESTSNDSYNSQYLNGDRTQKESLSNSNTVSRVFRHNLEGKAYSDDEHATLLTGQPYELRVVEAALASVASVLRAEYVLTDQQVSDSLKMSDLSILDADESLVHTELNLILDLTRKISGIKQRSSQVRDIAQELLNEDEDMANMHLTDKHAGKPHAAQDHQDVEYLFEAYFKATEAVVQDATILMKNIQRTEETIKSSLSVRRNQLMLLEVKIEILMLALAGATLIAGWYGMNVVNYLEGDKNAFAAILVVSLTTIFSASWYGMRKLQRIRGLRL
ncbi:uncharacterized protein TRUGW13939_04770 [Talaromyces rugulosus]|uniref:Magnesium transporter n=1 Tax=Talaromyces rugulosus TaxID=121627 RepID=A0A7H8QUG6_TALRU|nr:uncharacterized protein TRUGW13939_04770 [Talaromyces rugulosus]QKX57652.1 hypothetical protein TRUGW13939_04770 [Talaromyces rugulosus]